MKMSDKESIMVQDLLRRAREAVAMNDSDAEPDYEEIVIQIIKDPATVPAEARSEIAKDLETALTRRKRASHAVKRRISYSHSESLRAFDRCTAFADLINSRMFKIVFATSKRSAASKRVRYRRTSEMSHPSFPSGQGMFYIQ